MPRFRKKPIVIEATQWFKDGDHPKVTKSYESGICKVCNKSMDEHGWINTLEGGHIVCPTDWIITGVHGEHYAIKNDILHETYELIEDYYL